MTGDQSNVSECVRRALVEDLDDPALDLAADVTSRLSVPPSLRARARIHSKASGVLAGIDCATTAFRMLDASVELNVRLRDGARLSPGDVVMEIAGNMRAVLAAERTALNFLQRLSGVATQTAKFVAAVAGTGARILDTRKTTPGLRMLEKRAVLAGGGANHRIGLHDQVLLKENHFACALPVGYADVVRRCVAGHLAPVVAEARNDDEALQAVHGGAAVVLLDNYAPGEPLRRAVQSLRSAAKALGRHVEIEASGGVRLDNVRQFAEAGVDRISVGALTHSAPALDLSLLVEDWS